jgi:hypothetical protein
MTVLRPLGEYFLGVPAAKLQQSTTASGADAQEVAHFVDKLSLSRNDAFFG